MISPLKHCLCITNNLRSTPAIRKVYVQVERAFGPFHGYVSKPRFLYQV